MTNKPPDFQVDNSNPYLQVKVTPETWNEFVRELNSGRHSDIVKEAQKCLSFSEVIGTVAAKLDIVLDGSYDMLPTCAMLLSALQRKVSGNTQPHNLDPSLVPVNLIEREGSLTLEEKLEEEKINHVKVDPGEGPYTVCNGCTTTFDCCVARDCKLGREVKQLGNTIGIVRKLSKGIIQ